MTRNRENIAPAVLCLALTCGTGVHADERWKPIPANITIETGDTWIADGQRHRLYGVQSCLRGTAFTNASGHRQDCGDASLAMLAALIRDLKPLCATVAHAADATRQIVCTAAVQHNGSAERLDLGMALIATGFAFAALAPNGQPVHPGYGVAEHEAKQARAGLWSTGTFQHPARLLRGKPE